MQRPKVLSEAYPEPLLAAMTEEHREAARLSAAESSHWAQEVGRVLAAIRVDAMASRRERPAGPEVHFRDVAAVADLAVREQAKVWPLPAVRWAASMSLEEVQLAQALAVQEQAVARSSEPETAAVEEQPSEVRVAVAAQPWEARAAVVGQPSAEQRQAVLPSAEPSVAPQALSLLVARLARQRTTLPSRGPEVMRFERSRSQSLRAGSIEFVSWRPVREKESNNVLK